MLKNLKPGQEFDENVFQTTFKALDKNNDGSVSLEELTEDFVSKAREQGVLDE